MLRDCQSRFCVFPIKKLRDALKFWFCFARHIQGKRALSNFPLAKKKERSPLSKAQKIHCFFSNTNGVNNLLLCWVIEKLQPSSLFFSLETALGQIITYCSQECESGCSTETFEILENYCGDALEHVGLEILRTTDALSEVLGQMTNVKQIGEHFDELNTHISASVISFKEYYFQNMGCNSRKRISNRIKKKQIFGKHLNLVISNTKEMFFFQFFWHVELNFAEKFFGPIWTFWKCFGQKCYFREEFTVR